MLITINGQSTEVAEGSSVAELIAQLSLIPNQIAVEINEQLVPRKLFCERQVTANDRIEIVTFVGGG